MDCSNWVDSPDKAAAAGVGASVAWATEAVVSDAVGCTAGAVDATCVAGAPEVRLAYAIVTGTTPAALTGSTFLVDPVGWLRARLRPSVPPPDFDALARQIIANPILAPAGVGHHH